ncbi:ABC transporter substrate-binding protein [Nocardioides sp. cx-173]|uniref:ABC transporter substrate-binding protein n=1 Tax=Nocardioides sp. cx-173 TaxID=2898796 RepID=UPI001E55B069|nr:ABC transporter substrate-binding protein [Nocardioides sp. cx-173]MCD4525590.1 ABC transporter substrate-binding protein [Nocardioides sp. cx-173]UGB42734.1 ABC transporter substrate-binding protein [Nocardioides sp. cx-173]
MTQPSFARTRALRLGAVAAAAVLALAACGSDDEKADDGSGGGSGDGLGDITVQLSWIKNAEFAGEFIADDKGYYTEAGFDGVELLAGPVGTEELVATGKADFGLSNAISTAAAIANSDFPLKIVGTTFQKNPFSILSLADGGNIQTPQDLVGKKIGVQDPNLSLFNALLAANDIDPDDVEIVPNGFDIAPLEDGQIDGLVAYVTNESLLVAGHGFDTVDLTFADNGLPFVAESVITTDEMIESKPDVVKGFLEAEIKGWKDACADTELGAKLAVEKYGADIDPPLEMEKEIAQADQQCELLVNTDETAANGLFTISDEMIEANLASLEAAEIDVTAEDLFDTSLLAEVLEENPELVE